MKELFKDLLFFITHWSYWSMIYPYDEEYDKYLNSLLDNHVFKSSKKFNSFEVELGDEVFYYRNEPYGCFTNIYSKKFPAGRIVRPSRRTIHKALRKLKKHIKNSKYI